VTGTDRITATFQKLVQAERAEEEARRAKRSKRKAAANPDAATTPDVAAMEAAVAAEANQKITKKAQKEIAGRLADKEQHKSANEAARMAVTGLMGNRFGSKKGKTYDWMNAGKSGTSTPHTPSRLPGSATASAVGTPSADRPRPQAKEKRFSAWDEDKDPGIQARDVLLVLETDGRAPKTYLKALNQLEG
jgi:Transcription initiation factor TFIID component TAF4 family